MNMTRNRTFRPRVDRDQRDRLITTAEKLNGGSVEHGFHSALEKLLRYFDVLEGGVSTCPHCDGTDVDPRWARSESGDHFQLPEGKYWCESCDSVFDAWEYIGVEDSEAAQFPGLPHEITYTFEADGSTEADDTPGTNGTNNDSLNPIGDW